MREENSQLGWNVLIHRPGELTNAVAKEANALCSADRIVQQLQSILPDAGALVENLADTLPGAPASAWTDAVLLGWAEAKIAAAARYPTQLQRGRGLSTAETVVSVTLVVTSTRLQRGRGLSTAET